MRKSKVIAGLLTMALCITPCSGVVYQTSGIVKAETAETEQATSQDGMTVYRELEDGTVSIVSYLAEPEISDDSTESVLTFPDTVDGKVVSEIEGDALVKNYSALYLTQIVLPKELRALDVAVFRNCFYNTYIQIDESNEYFQTEDGVLYSKGMTKLIRVPEVYTPAGGEKATDYVIPDSVTEIGEDAFYNTIGDMHVTISANVESIGECALYHSLGGSGKFTFTVVPENSYFTATERGDLFSKDMTVLYRHVYTVDETSYTIPDTVTVIASAAFEGSVEDSFTGLAEVVIPEGVTTIGTSAFEGCAMLGDGFVAISAGTSTELVIPDSVTYIGESAFEGCAMESVVLPKNLTRIETGVFYECKYLSNITMPDSITYIGHNAFYDCAMETVSLPKELTELGVDTFGNCYNLTELTIPDKVTSLGDGTFANCISLKKVTLGKRLKDIGALAFCGCTNLTEVVLPDGLETIGEEAFVNCPMLDRLTVPDSVTTIGDRSIGYCWEFDEETGEGDWGTVDGFALTCTADSKAVEYAKANSLLAKDSSGNILVKPETSAKPSQAPTQSPETSTEPSQAPSQKPDASAVPSQTPTAAPSQTPKASVTPVPTQSPDTGAVVNAPAAVKLTTVKNVKGKKLQIAWVKNAKAAGYEVQYAASSKFKGAKSVVINSAKTTKASVKKLKKGKKYFVRVRAYVTADSGKKYSKWSNVKKAVIKK